MLPRIPCVGEGESAPKEGWHSTIFVDSDRGFYTPPPPPPPRGGGVEKLLSEPCIKKSG